MNKEATQILRNMERREKRRDRATVAATLFVLAPFALIALLIGLALIF